MSIDNLCEVTNRDSGFVGYRIPDTGVHRNFAPGETKKVPREELKALQYTPGGDFILEHLLTVKDKDFLNDELNIHPEPEYYYTEADIVKLLTTGSLDQLLDCLDFAPEGVIEIIKKKAVELQIPDITKRDAITKKTGFNVNNAINVNQIMDAEDAPAEKVAADGQRRVAAPSVDAEAPKRRAAAPEYKIISGGPAK